MQLALARGLDPDRPCTPAQGHATLMMRDALVNARLLLDAGSSSDTRLLDGERIAADRARG
jgi:hypothetical protein